MDTPSCQDCANCKELESGKLLCALKAEAIILYDGSRKYRTDIGLCHNERVDSTGLFGLFKDHTRCGSAGKNFYPKK